MAQFSAETHTVNPIKPRRHDRATSRGVRRAVVSSWLILTLFGGCATEHGHQPGAEFGVPITSRDPQILQSLLLSTSTPEDSRKSADRLLVEAQGEKSAVRLDALEQILYAPGQSDAMRIYAMDQLSAA